MVHMLEIVSEYYRLRTNGHHFTITEADIQAKKLEFEGDNGNLSMAENRCAKENSLKVLFPKVVLWALEQNAISCNMLSENFHLGWRRANELIGQLHDAGIVGELDAKLPRKVLPQCFEEVPEAVLDILRHNGISSETVSDAISNRMR